MPQKTTTESGEITICIDWEGPFVPFIPRDLKTGEWGKKAKITFHHAAAAFAPSAESKKTDLDDKDKDFGIYQIYGTNSAYGTDVLLYIGLAGERLTSGGRQTFARRLRKHTYDYGFTDLKFYVGRLMGKNQPGLEKWSQHIRLAEKLLIFFNPPSDNSKSITSLWRKNTPKCASDDYSKSNDKATLKTRRVRVRNYSDYKSLVPECSSDSLRDHSLYDKEEAKWYSRNRK